MWGVSRLPTYAFSYEFTHIPEFARDHVSSSERERVIYEDHWIEELKDFRHTRIAFTDDEAREYARRTWAYELFLRAGHPYWAKDAPNIDPDIAHDADSYAPIFRDGSKVIPPYLCFAAFLGSLENLHKLPGRQTVIELQGRESALFTLTRAVQALTPTMRTFNSREKGLQPWTVSREDDVRDLLYVMLKPVLFDLVKEEPTPSLAGTHKFVDLSSKASRIFIEVKWIGKKNQWRAILGQIQIDIQSYSTHPNCETLVFVVVDEARDIPDPRLLEKEISGKQRIRKRQFEIRLYIVEP
jgi:DpnII restriction endonuclease